MSASQVATSQEIKACCAAAYASDWIRLLIGDSMHPGGVWLTERLGELIQRGPRSQVLDVAAGRGVSALRLTRRFGCQVVGLSPANVTAAREAAVRSGLDALVSFDVADAESLSLPDSTFDALTCECAFCTFPDKTRAASEMARVLRPGGRLGLSDLVRRAELPDELQTLAGWVACIADARPEAEYVRCFEEEGFRQPSVEVHDDSLLALLDQVRGRLLTATVLGRAGKLKLGDADLKQARAIARTAEAAVRKGILGYILLTAVKA